ncbi:MAG: helix-turn-helix transcriptional regulator [Terracidiphilus sp.]|nr:helix-turn-helix transcriptional regulator [Terracidiphilus sp.]
MSNGVPARILPHLTPEEISDRDHQESRLNRELSKCWRGDHFDAERAFQVLRAYTVEIFDVVYPAFQKKIGYESAWIPDIVGDTIFRALTVYEAHNAHGMPSMGVLSQTLEATLLDHLKELKSREDLTLTGKQASAYAASGVDLASGSPLLMMIAAAGRGAHLQPSNVRSGKRIGRSIHSDKAARRMEAYIQEKGITQTQFSVAVNADTKTLYRFRRTGKVEKSVAKRIAEAMGITLEQFTA